MADPTPQTLQAVPFTNTSARLYQIAGQTFKPGDTIPVDGEYVEKLRKTPAVKSGDLKEGRVSMPSPRPLDKPAVLPADDVAKALAYIRAEDELAILHTWTSAESGGAKRPEILTALTERAKSLAGK